MINFVACQVFLVWWTVGMTHGAQHTYKRYCWPVSASFQHPDPYPSCPGVTVYKLKTKPHPVGPVDETISVTYVFRLNDSFYSWAFQKGIFDGVKSTYTISTAELAKQWCEETACPSQVRKANEENCCLYYANVHHCHAHETSAPVHCRPWLMEQGHLISTSRAQVGPVQKGKWTFDIHLEGLSEQLQKELSLTQIAVFKVAKAMIVLEDVFTFQQNTVCGNGKCEGGESCGSCPDDCGQCIGVVNIVVIIIASIILILITTVFCLLLRSRRRRHRALHDESWIIDPKEILGAREALSSNSAFFVAENPTKKKDHKEYAFPAISAMVPPSLRKASAALYSSTSVATVRGEKVAVKKYHNANFQLTQEIRKEVFKVRLLLHPNLCRFVGATVHPGNLYILFEYCPKGSLVDVIQNDTMTLNWSFRFSMLADVSRGMAYLHRHNVMHGNLKSCNCVVDDRWICKVTDFGLAEYRREDYLGDDEEFRVRAIDRERQDQVYRAPEADTKPQPASDVFSYAIILIEVAKRERITYIMTKEPQSVLGRSSLGAFMSSESLALIEPSSATKRVHKTESGFFARYQELIRRCWADNPSDRPTFEAIEAALLKMHPRMKNPVDSMMALMQMYSKNLEQLVEKRSRQLLEEKSKTEALLYSILPRPVADSLRNGRQVAAECYEASTIFFSDIVGFTTLSSRSTPMQIVDLLNKLYTSFDSVIEKHNVYKVETIGDAYMVVSGVPNRTPMHAYNVSLMALEIMDSAAKFIIPHCPGERLYIKAGLDSGPVCAGVVGIKMPRYCLFGDTVNTASRMETYSKAGKIHISSSTYHALQFDDCFEFDLRGNITVKGKGDMVTWWLLGVKNQAKQQNSFPEDCLTQRDSSHEYRFLTNVYNM